MRKSELRKIIREEADLFFQEESLTNEQTALNEIEMSFWDWIVGGAGIELGRYATQFAITLAFVGLSGLAAGVMHTTSKIVQKYNQLKRDRQSNRAAKEGQEYIAKTPLVKELIQILKKLDSKPDLRKKANQILVKELKSKRGQIGKQIAKDVGLGKLSREAFEYLTEEIPYLKHVSHHAR